MSVKINYLKNKVKPTSNIVLFAGNKFDVSGLKKSLPDTEFSYISDLLKSSDLKKNLLVFEINSKRKIVLVSIKNNLRNSDIENLGAELYVCINYGKNNEYFLNTDNSIGKYKNFIGYKRLPSSCFSSLLQFSFIFFNRGFMMPKSF